jgi:anti-sigma factor RsiW
MTHREIQEKLFALYDGPLTEQERALVEGHLAGCGDCRGSIAEWKRISETLFRLPAFSEAEEDRFVSKVMGRLEPAPPKRAFTLRWLVPLVGTAVAAAWVLFFVLPATPGFSSNSTVADIYSEDSTDMEATQWSDVPPSSASGQIVQAFYREP